MAKKWIGSVDVEVGSGGGPAVEGAIDHIVAAEYRVVIPATSALITALSGGPTSLPDDLVAIGLIPFKGMTADVHYQDNAPAVVATSPQWAEGGVDYMPLTAERARRLRFISSSGSVNATLYIIGPRAA